MCILLAIARTAPSAELWIAANRDEQIDRSWAAPRLLASSPRVFGGLDVLAGGTWLAVNLDAGFVVAVTNARLHAPRGDRSRGHLVVDVASQPSIADAVALLPEVDFARYGPFNLLVGDSAGRWVATNAPEPRLDAATGPVLAIGNELLSDPGQRVRFAAERARAAAGSDETDLTVPLKRVLADHEGVDPLCRHGERYGTVCSTILTIRDGSVERYVFAPGRPCEIEFAAVALPG